MNSNKLTWSLVASAAGLRPWDKAGPLFEGDDT